MKVTRLVNFVGRRFTKARETVSTIEYEREHKWLADALISRYSRSPCEFMQPGFLRLLPNARYSSSPVVE